MFPNRIRWLKAYKTETTPARVKLSSNELPHELPAKLKEDICKALRQAPFNRYPDPEAKELKEIIAQLIGVSPSNIMLGNGSDELIYYLTAVLGEPGNGFLIPVPTFPMYEISAQVFNRRTIKVPLKEDFDLSLEDCLSAVKKENVRIAYYSYPNNPTGNLFSRSHIEKIRVEGVFTISDEAYYHYSGESFKEDALFREDTVVLRTLSKIGLAGLRVGILIGSEAVVKELEKVRLPFNITYPSQVIAKVVLTKGREFIEEAVKEVIRERERLYEELSRVEGIKPYPSKANFILIRTEFEAKRLHRELVKEGVLIRNMSHLQGLEGCLRISVGKPLENDALLEALNKVVARLQ